MILTLRMKACCSFMTPPSQPVEEPPEHHTTPFHLCKKEAAQSGSANRPSNKNSTWAAPVGVHLAWETWIPICSFSYFKNIRIEGSWLKQHQKNEELFCLRPVDFSWIKWSHILSITCLTCLQLHQSVQQGECCAWNVCAAQDKNVMVHHDHPLLLYAPQQETQVILVVDNRSSMWWALGHAKPYKMYVVAQLCVRRMPIIAVCSDVQRETHGRHQFQVVVFLSWQTFRPVVPRDGGQFQINIRAAKLKLRLKLLETKLCLVSV